MFTFYLNTAGMPASDIYQFVKCILLIYTHVVNSLARTVLGPLTSMAFAINPELAPKWV